MTNTDITINCCCQQMSSTSGEQFLIATGHCPIHDREARVNLLLKLWSENNPHCQGFGSQELVAEIRRLRAELSKHAEPNERYNYVRKLADENEKLTEELSKTESILKHIIRDAEHIDDVARDNIKELEQELAIFKEGMPPLTHIWNFCECVGGDDVCGWLSGIVRKLREK